MLAVAATPASAFAAGAGNFTLVNGTGGGISEVSIRRAGTNDWKPLAAAPAAGARGSVQFNDPDCAFDIRATLAGGVEAVWKGVNLCEAKVVVLHRDASGATWAEYE